VCLLGFPSACALGRSTTEAPDKVLTSAAFALDRSPRLLCTGFLRSAAPVLQRSGARSSAVLVLRQFERFGSRPVPALGHCGQLLRSTSPCYADPALVAALVRTALRRSTTASSARDARSFMCPAFRRLGSPALDHSGATLHVFVYIFHSCCSGLSLHSLVHSSISYSHQ